MFDWEKCECTALEWKETKPTARATNLLKLCRKPYDLYTRQALMFGKSGSLFIFFFCKT